MICSACGVANSADSKFCKACGRQILADAFPEFVPSVQSAPPTPEERAAQLKRLLEMAFWHSDAGNDAAAIKAAQAALAVDSSCVTALSLIGCLYERTGRPDLAIEAFERVVELNPDSEADAEKLHALRNGVHLEAVPQPASHRYIPPVLINFVTRYPSAPLVGGAAAAFLIVFIGLLVLVPIAQSGPKVTGRAPQAGAATMASAAASPTANVAQSTMLPAESPLSAAATAINSGPSQTIVPGPRGSVDPFANFPSGVTSARINRPPPPRRGTPGPLPPLNDDGSVPSVLSVRPIAVNSGASAFNPIGVPQHQVDVAAPSAPTAPASQPQSDGPPPPATRIHISFGNGEPGNMVGNSPGSQRSGQIAEDGGGALQQQAIAQQNKGDYTAAEASYRSAIAAYRNDINAGRNVDFARRGIDACETGIQICRASE